MVATVTADGFRRLTEDEAGGYAQAVVDERMRSPAGPSAPPQQPAERIAPGAAVATTIARPAQRH